MVVEFDRELGDYDQIIVSEDPGLDDRVQKRPGNVIAIACATMLAPQGRADRPIVAASGK